MKLCKLFIPDYQQFRHLELDFTHPETGEPLNQICLIGPNGTGKTTILELLITFLKEPHRRFLKNGAVEIDHNGRRLLCLASEIGWKIPDGSHSESLLSGAYIYLDAQAENEINWQDELFSQPTGQAWHMNSKAVVTTKAYRDLMKKYGPYVVVEEHGSTYESLYLKDHSIDQQRFSPDLLIYSRAEAPTNPMLSLDDVPQASVDQALSLFQKLPFYHEVSQESSSDFWRQLIYQLKLRERQRDEFERLPENLEKTKRQLIGEFDQAHPDILTHLAALWNQILGQAGLELDLEHIGHPLQLTDNLKAYIRLKATGEPIPYNRLSAGIRNFLFRLGHVYALFFEREIERGFLFVDEPENSLFPDLLQELSQRYRDLTTDKRGQQNTQIFMATHSPLVAAQFQPYERIILDWNNDGNVSVRRGTAPIGDDPNDVLRKDFELPHLLGPEGQKMWKKYLDLRQRLQQSQNADEKKRLLKEISFIGNSYEFDEA